MNESGSAAGGIVTLIIGLAAGVFYMAAMWKLFTKAGQPGWAIFVPIYNLYVIAKITGKPFWWAFVPVMNIIFLLSVPFALAKNFGRGGGFGFGLLVLPPVFVPILAFGESRYSGPAAA